MHFVDFRFLVKNYIQVVYAAHLLLHRLLLCVYVRLQDCTTHSQTNIYLLTQVKRIDLIYVPIST